MDGCMRCKYGATPQCKVHSWKEELIYMRALLHEFDLHEERKWSFPCYTRNGKNVLMLTVFKHYCGISFFKGALIQDSDNRLVAAGEHSQSARQLRFQSIQDVIQSESDIRDFILQAIRLEDKGARVTFKKQDPSEIPEELAEKFKSDSAFERAFKALTPGRQRGYILHFSAAKKSETRSNRIEQYSPRILAGKGMQDPF
ncbi:MAG: YdeI/OmpD-associated family protein [Flavobacteriales bacterium]